MNRDERAELGPIIRAERERLRMTQAELADAAGTTMRSVGSIERGDTVAQPQLLARLLTALGLTPDGHPSDPTDPDIETLVAVVRPFLATLDDRHRAVVMPKLIEALVREMRTQIMEDLQRGQDAQSHT